MRLSGGKRASRRLVEFVAGLCAIALSTSAVTAFDAFAGAWRPPMPLSDRDPSTGFAPDVGRYEVRVAPDGTVVAAWLRSDGANRRVEASIKPTFGGWTAPQRISAPGVDAGTPQLAVDGDGNAIAMWAAAGVTYYALRDAGANEFGEPRPAITVPAVDDVVFDSAGEAVAVWTAAAQASASPQGGSTYINPPSPSMPMEP
jgi:hypothetical protein